MMEFVLSIEDVLFDQASVLKFDGAQKDTGIQRQSFDMEMLFSGIGIAKVSGKNVATLGNKQFAWAYSATNQDAFHNGIIKELASGTALIVIKKTSNNPDAYCYQWIDDIDSLGGNIPNTVEDRKAAGFREGAGDKHTIKFCIRKFCGL